MLIRALIASEDTNEKTCGSLRQRHSRRTARGNEVTMSILKPGDVNSDGKEIEQDGWVTVSEIQIPTTETDKENDG